jgi:hypothetical protein
MGSSLMYFMPGWQEKSMQVRMLHAVGDSFQYMTLIPPAKSSQENNLFNVRYFEGVNQVFPDWGMHATPVTLRSGQMTARTRDENESAGKKDLLFTAGIQSREREEYLPGKRGLLRGISLQRDAQPREEAFSAFKAAPDADAA